MRRIYAAQDGSFGPSVAQGGEAKVQSLPAPTGGWNARDSFANMAPGDAVSLVNMFPDVSNVVLRGGYSKFATGLDGQVQTLMSYAAGATTSFFAITDNGSIYDVSLAGPVGMPVVTGLANGWWEYTNITTPGGSFLVLVNGVDSLLLYDGTTWAPIDDMSSPAITGVATSDLSNVVLFKHRLWFIQKNTLVAWYLPTDSVAGAAEMLDLSELCRFGGHLVDLDAWTLDAGYGVDDNLAFVSSNGEVIVYAGTDPASDTTWSLIGVWKLGSPMGVRSMLKWGGDLLILTYDGLMPMAGSLQSSRLDPRIALSDKIQGAITAATTAYGATHDAKGWQVYYTAKTNAVWINVPIGVGSQQQYAMNTITKSWAQFTGWAANVWETFEDDPYFGGDGFVGKAWDSTYADDGANIPTVALQAFNYFGQRGVKKYFTRARPSIFSDGAPAIFIGMNVDFDTSNTTAPLSYNPASLSLWGSAVWDAATWSSGTVITNTWLGITGIGYCGGVQFQSASTGVQIEWASTDIVYQTGWAGI